MRTPALILANLLVIVVFASLQWAYVTPPGATEPFTRKHLSYATPDGRKQMPIPQAVQSKRQRIKFYMSCLDHRELGVRVVAARILASQLRYYPARHKIWNLCNDTSDKRVLDDLLFSFGLIAEEDLFDEIISRYQKETDKLVRIRLIQALAGIRTKRVKRFVFHIALNSDDRKEAYTAACIVARYNGPEAIRVLEKYLRRPDAVKRQQGRMDLPRHLEVMRNRLTYFVALIIAGLVSPVVAYGLSLRLFKQPKRSLSLSRPVAIEVTLLVLLAAWAAWTVMTTLGSGDAGAVTAAFLYRRSFQQVLLLVGLYSVSVYSLAKHLCCLRYAANHGVSRRLVVASTLMLAIVFTNIFIMVNSRPYTALWR